MLGVGNLFSLRTGQTSIGRASEQLGRTEMSKCLYNYVLMQLGAWYRQLFFLYALDKKPQGVLPNN